MERVIGHQPIIDFFTKAFESGSLSHAYCFTGPDMVGKKRVAESIAAKILGVDYKKLLANPDYVLIEKAHDEKTGKTKKDISIEQLRDLREKLARHSFLGGYKVVVVDEAESMSIEAANALLKTLEEPKTDTIIFLITSDEKKLLGTVQSRCQLIYFYPILNDLLVNYLSEQGLKSDDAVLMAKLAHGLPGLAITWLTDQEKYQNYTNEMKRFGSLFGKAFYQKNALVEEIFGEKGKDVDHVLGRMRLQSILDIWQLLLRDLIFKKQKMPNYLINSDLPEVEFSFETALSIEEKINQARDLLDKNIHPRLLIEQILLQIP